MTPPPTADGSCLPVSCFSHTLAVPPRLSTNTPRKGGSHLSEQRLPFLEVWERPGGGETAAAAMTPLHHEAALGKPVARSLSGSSPAHGGRCLWGEVSGWSLLPCGLVAHSNPSGLHLCFSPQSHTFCSQVPYLGSVNSYSTGSGAFLLFKTC